MNTTLEVPPDAPCVMIASDGTRWQHDGETDDVRLLGPGGGEVHDLYVLLNYWGLTFTIEGEEQS